MIAATALEHGMTVVTRYVADFVGTGMLLVNPLIEQVLDFPAWPMRQFLWQLSGGIRAAMNEFAGWGKLILPNWLQASLSDAR